MKNLFFLLLIPFFVFSQDYSQYYNNVPIKNGKIYGKVKDQKTSDLLEFATITLLSKDIQQAVEGTITDSKGSFLIDSLSMGKYEITISFIGYETQTIDLELTDDFPVKNLKTVKLSISSELLDAAELVDEKPIYESSFEKIIYNPENDLGQTSNDALDVLRQTPLLSVHRSFEKC